MQRFAAWDDGQQLLALMEAQVGQLVDVLPVPLLVGCAAGNVLRANASAVALLGSPEALIGRPIEDVLRGRDLSVRVKTLYHGGDIVRLYVLYVADVDRAWTGSSRTPAA